MPPQQSSIRSSACFHRYPLPVSGKDEPGCQGISEAVMPGQAAGPGVGREPSPTLLPTAASVATVGRDRFPTPAPTGDVHTTVGRRPIPTVAPTVALEATVGRDPFPTVPPTVAPTDAMTETVATGQHPTDAPTVAPRPSVGRHGFPTVVFRATVEREPVPTLLPTVVLKATVGRDPFPTLPPTVALDTTVGRRPFPTVAWQPCLAQPGSSLNWPASVFSVFAAAARTPLYTAPVRELVILRCLKKERRGLTTLKRYVLGKNGTSPQRGVRATERRFA